MIAENDCNLSAAYAAKADAYFGNPRVNWVDSLPADPNAAILEIGCGDGATGHLALSKGRCGSYVGVELYEPAAERARGVLTHVHTGNIESMVLPYAEGAFDALIMGDVLEHLVEPEETLRRLAPLLKPGGLFFASVPNVAHWMIILGLLLGRFDYTESGALDRTHLRWFTPRSMRRMVEQAGVVVDRVAPLGSGSLPARLSYLLGHVAWYQIDLKGHKQN